MSNKKFEDLNVFEIIQMGIAAGVEYVQKQEEIKLGCKKDKRLRNTKLLLKIYRDLKVHVKEAGCTTEKIKSNDILEIFDEFENELTEEKFVHSIFKSKTRTTIFLAFIDKILDWFKFRCSNDRKYSKYLVIEKLYLEDNKKPNKQDVCEELKISNRTLDRYEKEAVQDLAVLLFGIDALDLR